MIVQDVLQTGSQDKMHNADISTITLHFAYDKHSKETHPYIAIITSTSIPLCFTLGQVLFFRVKH